MAWFSPNRPPSPRRSSSYSHSHSHSQYAPSSHSKSNGYYYRTSSHSHTSRARPRDGYVERLVHQVQRYLRRLYSYARRHPVKLLMMLLPLLTGGALAGILAKFGIRLPRGMENLMGGGRSRSSMSGSGFGGAGGIQGLMKFAQHFV